MVCRSGAATLADGVSAWSAEDMTQVTGLVLAAGAGRRMGTPKALLRDPDGTSWLLRTIAVVRDGGCGSVVVVLGAEGGSAARLLEGQDVITVVAADWDEGMGASLRAGLTHLLDTDAAVALVTLVDLPDVGSDVVARVVSAAGGDPDGLVRAAYAGVPGHPVALGRTHWPPVMASTVGDRGARDYLSARSVTLVECADLASGSDVDRTAVVGGTDET